MNRTAFGGSWESGGVRRSGFAPRVELSRDFSWGEVHPSFDSPAADQSTARLQSRLLGS